MGSIRLRQVGRLEGSVSSCAGGEQQSVGMGPPTLQTLKDPSAFCSLFSFVLHAFMLVRFALHGLGLTSTL